jgi:hypothetical protein
VHVPRSKEPRSKKFDNRSERSWDTRSRTSTVADEEDLKMPEEEKETAPADLKSKFPQNLALLRASLSPFWHSDQVSMLQICQFILEHA